MRLALAAAVLLLAGCTDPVVMRNPATGEATDCGSRYGAGFYAFSANDRMRDCVRDYQAQGWLRSPR